MTCRRILILSALVPIWLLAGPRVQAQSLPVALGDLAPGTIAPDDAFGASVSVDGTWCAVGAPGDDTFGVDAGAVYLFGWSGSEWSLAVELFASDALAGDGFGTAVALSGDRLVVGAPLEDPQGLMTGAVYVFDFQSPAGWTESAKVFPAVSVGSPAEFGQSVDVAGDVLVVGAPAFVGPGSGLQEGRTSIYRFDGVAWNLEFEEPYSSGLTRRGESVATDGDHVAEVGSFQMHTYEYSGGVWVDMAPSFAAGGPHTSNKHVDIAGARLFAMTSVTDVTVYELVGGAWTTSATITPATSTIGLGCASNPGFGYSLELDGDLLLIGSPCQVDAMGTTTGATFLYLDTGSSWVPLWESYGTNDAYGAAVGLGAGRFVSGAFASDATMLAAGGAQAFELVSSTSYCTAKPSSLPGCTALMSSTGVPSYGDPDAFTMEAGPAPGQRLGIFFWGTSGPAEMPFKGGTLCVAPPIHRAGAQLSSGTVGLCDGEFALTLGAISDKIPGFAPGLQLHVQAWFRDPGDPFGSALSDGLTFIVGN